MSTYILITTENYDGQMAQITFYPTAGGSINLGTVLLPYEYYTDDFYGRYSIYIPSKDVTCELRFITPTPTKTPTQTPSNTPTNTPTKTVTPTVTPTTSVSPTMTPTVTPTNTSTLTPTPTKTKTPTPTVTRTPIPTRTPTKTPTPTVTNTRTPIPTRTPTPTPTQTQPLDLICFSFGSEAVGGNSYSTSYVDGEENGKPKYVITYGSIIDMYVIWNPVLSRWDAVRSDTLVVQSWIDNPNRPIVEDGYVWNDAATFEVVNSFLGVCCICTKIEYLENNSYEGTYSDCNQTTQNWVIFEAGEPYTYICVSNTGSITYDIIPEPFTSIGNCVDNECLIPTPTPTITPTTTNPSCLCVEVVISQTDINNAVKNTIGPFDNTVFFQGNKESNCDGSDIIYEFTSPGTYYFCVKSSEINTLSLFYYFENVPQFFPSIQSDIIISDTGCNVDTDCGINPSPTATPTLTPTPTSTNLTLVRYNLGSCCPKLPGGIMDVPSVYGIGDVILATNGYCYTINEIGTRPPTLIYLSSYIDCETCGSDNNPCPSPTPTVTPTKTLTPTPTTTPSNLACFGYLYNFYAITGTTSQSLTSSDDWSVPTKSDFDNLLITVANNANVLKLVDTTIYWNGFNISATNSSGFSGIGNGLRNSLGFFNQKQISLYKTKTIFDASGDYHLVLSAGISSANVIYGSTRQTGGPVRLVKNSTLLSPGQTGIYTGNDGKTYTTICIGTQEWMSKDLREEMYRNLSAIPNVTDQTTWGGLTTGAYCIYNNDPNNVSGCVETYL